MWQEMRQRNTNWSSEGGTLTTNKPQNLPEPIQVDQSQKALTKGNQSELMN